jgi:hypothetical protein
MPKSIFKTYLVTVEFVKSGNAEIREDEKAVIRMRNLVKKLITQSTNISSEVNAHSDEILEIEEMKI